MPSQPVNLVAAKNLVKRVESSHASKCVAFLTFGVPLSMIGPLIVTGIMAMYTIDQAHPRPFQFWPTLLKVSAIALPILYLLAWMVKGSVLDKSAEALNDYDDPVGGLGRGRAVPALLVLDMANIGPRMVLHGVKLMHRRKCIGGVDLDRAALAVQTLAQVDGGISPAKLLRPGEDASILQSLLAFLMFHELIDISKTGDRVWLRSETRTKLEKLR